MQVITAIWQLMTCLLQCKGNAMTPQSACSGLKLAYATVCIILKILRLRESTCEPGLKMALRGGGRRGSTTITPGPPGCITGMRCGGGCKHPRNTIRSYLSYVAVQEACYSSGCRHLHDISDALPV